MAWHASSPAIPQPWVFHSRSASACHGDVMLLYFYLGYEWDVHLSYENDHFVEWLQMLILNQHQWNDDVFLVVCCWGLLKAYLGLR